MLCFQLHRVVYDKVLQCEKKLSKPFAFDEVITLNRYCMPVLPAIFCHVITVNFKQLLVGQPRRAGASGPRVGKAP